jgi:hypothetical protein
LTGWSLAGEVHVGPVAQDLKNVVATLEAEGPLADETVVVGGHYDHLGYGGGWGSLAPWTREIHNGADDNASGTAVVIELARLLAADPARRARRVMFIAFTAEESGLIGSQHYVEHPLVPLEQTVAMLNFDMVGYLRQNRLEVYGTGTAVEFDPLLTRFGSVHGLRLIREPDGDGPSDHANFFERGIPVLHFFTGFHSHYHRPSDDYERLNVEGLRRITQLGRDLVVQLAADAQRPQPRINSGLEWLVERPAPRAAPRTASGMSPAAGLGVRGQLGPAPPGGYVIREVNQRGIAARCGLRAGDCILQIGPQRIGSDNDFTEASRLLKPGATVPVLVQRGLYELEFEVVVP